MNFKYYNSPRLIILILALYFPCSYLSEQVETFLKNWKILDSFSRSTDLFSTIAFMTLAVVFINNVGWKWKFFKILVDLPNLNGRYVGELVSNYKDEDGNNVKKKCVLEIRQTASTIHIYSYFSDNGSAETSSTSHSIIVQVEKENNGFFKLYYIFANDTGTLQNELRNHAGTSIFNYYPDLKMLDGEYYNQRSNTGTLKVRFEQKKRLGRFRKEL